MIGGTVPDHTHQIDELRSPNERSRVGQPDHNVSPGTEGVRCRLDGTVLQIFLEVDYTMRILTLRKPDKKNLAGSRATSIDYNLLSQSRPVIF